VVLQLGSWAGVTIPHYIGNGTLLHREIILKEMLKDLDSVYE
jgi:hypothetical protein